MTTKAIMQTAVGIGSLALVKRSAKLLKKPTSKKLTKGYVDLAIGTALLVPISEGVNKL